ncbi:hypothetical protein BLTE_11580 [Blastochloris tepida]|uniref:Uncharacterized protein n=1 Tax=Blastochloris tepida TaxID=2233851 RepID=A0A348FYU0_9HYPH|nr:hypothetical protein BLTE_11580 [Blastochloris tepida]
MTVKQRGALPPNSGSINAALRQNRPASTVKGSSSTIATFPATKAELQIRLNRTATA